MQTSSDYLESNCGFGTMAETGSLWFRLGTVTGLGKLASHQPIRRSSDIWTDGM